MMKKPLSHLDWVNLAKEMKICYFWNDKKMTHPLVGRLMRVVFCRHDEIYFQCEEIGWFNFCEPIKVKEPRVLDDENHDNRNHNIRTYY
jgi:hypothetical protein